jgi:hypothetical protein
VENRVPSASLRLASRAGGRANSDPRYGGGRGGQNRACYGSSGAPSVGVNPDKSSLGSRQAPPIPIHSGPARPRPMTTHRIARPDPLARRVLTPMPQSPGTPFWASPGSTGPTRTTRHESRGVHAPVMTAASEPRVHHRPSNSARASASAGTPHCGRPNHSTPRSAGSACRSSDAWF